MNNYEYIIACLPVLDRDVDNSTSLDTDAVIDEIHERLDASDAAVLDFMLKGYDKETLGEEFYSKALRHGSRFIREYFSFDLDVRNTKVEHLNNALGREPGKDMVVLPGREDIDFELKPDVEAILSGTDILKKERSLDELMWTRADELTIMEVFSLDAILGFVARLKIIDRWLKLDPVTGREMFRKLVEQIRNNR